jgi:hypothetical protein
MNPLQEIICNQIRITNLILHVDYTNNPRSLLDDSRSLNQFGAYYWSRSTLTTSGLRPRGAGLE